MRAERGGEGLKTKGEDGRLDEIRGRKLRGGRWGGEGCKGGGRGGGDVKGRGGETMVRTEKKGERYEEQRNRWGRVEGKEITVYREEDINICLLRESLSCFTPNRRRRPASFGLTS